MTKLDSILKSRDVTLSTKVHLVKTIFLPVVMYGCESWTVKKAERFDAFELRCWKRLLRVLGLQGDQTSPSERKSTLNTHWKDCDEAEAPVFWPPDVRTDSLEKTLLPGKT